MNEEATVTVIENEIRRLRNIEHQARKVVRAQRRVQDGLCQPIYRTKAIQVLNEALELE